MLDSDKHTLWERFQFRSCNELLLIVVAERSKAETGLAGFQFRLNTYLRQCFFVTGRINSTLISKFCEKYTFHRAAFSRAGTTAFGFKNQYIEC